MNSSEGIATLIALMIMLMMTIIGVAALKIADDEISITGNEMNETAAFYAAEAGLELAAAELQTDYEASNAVPPDLPAGSQMLGDAASVAYVTSDNGPAAMRTLTYGSLEGLKALVKTYTTDAIGTSLTSGAQMTLSQDFECALIPVFQFAVFFNEELWAAPIFDATITGRVHANKDMYLKCSATGKSLTFKEKVTCGGNINAGFPYGGESQGDVRFANIDGDDVSMKQGSTWIDADFNEGGVTWYDTASSLWDGQVRDRSFGEESLNMPISGGDPHKLIERSPGNPDSFENKADLKVMDGVPYTKVGGVWQDISGFLPSNTITQDNSTRFYDGHEQEWVRNTQIDVSLLKASGYFPDNGVIYISDQRSATATEKLNAATLINGSEIGEPLTVACENPLYIRGNFNTQNKQPAAAICDAVTFLSNNWDPDKSASSYSSRPATPTEANISFITGDLAQQGTNYGGGLENLPRFLEDWNGTEFKFRGSMVEMWRSRQATGQWRYINGPNPYYSAPTRNWSFDTDLTDPAKLPPETPMVQIFQRTRWKQKSVGYSTAATGG